jgi:hypothetical protein
MVVREHVVYRETMTGPLSAVSSSEESSSTGVAVPLDRIASPGAYVCNWNGHLLRVPAGGIMPAGGLLLNLVGSEPLVATKIADDPELPITRLRGLAVDRGITVAF